jgi:hypothetical protein
MVLIHIGTVVVLSSCVTTTSGMRTVLSNTTVTGRDVSTLFTRSVGAGRHIELFCFDDWRKRNWKRKEYEKGDETTMNKVRIKIRANGETKLPT